MAEPDKQYTGDGNDNYADAAQKSAEAAKQLGQSSAGKAAAAGGEAAANAAAATVKAGVEGGKAVAEVAAGTAAAGPWGAVIAAAWSLRHTLFKILASVCLLLLFIIIMVVSLPSVVFNPDTAAVPASGSNPMTAMYEELSATVSACVSSGYDYAKAEVERIIASGGYDAALSAEAIIDYGQVSADYDVCYILAAYSVGMGQKGTSKTDLRNKLNAAAPYMFAVTYEEKETTVTVPAENKDSEAEVKTVKYVQCTINSFDASVIISSFGIDPDAIYGEFGIPMGEAVDHMAMALKRTLYGVTGSGQVPEITGAERIAFLDNLTCSPARKELIRTALSLVGRVPYFWGGKSAAGWNEEWNTPKLVTAAGSSSTGTIRPYGLDCSGFTDWVYKTALGVSLPGGSASQWDGSTEITYYELLPGDLGFMEKPGEVPINHILIYAGKGQGGGNLWVHCSSGEGGVALNSPDYVKYYRRVNDIDDVL